MLFFLGNLEFFLGLGKSFILFLLRFFFILGNLVTFIIEIVYMFMNF